ncbi:MAG: hypothetical protein ABR514_12330, partial [Chthoniobacterales bacterium]
LAAALIVGFLGEFAVELTAFHFTTAVVHFLACYATDRLLLCAEGACHKERRCETRVQYPSHVLTSFRS